MEKLHYYHDWQHPWKSLRHVMTMPSSWSPLSKPVHLHLLVHQPPDTIRTPINSIISVLLQRLTGFNLATLVALVHQHTKVTMRTSSAHWVAISLSGLWARIRSKRSLQVCGRSLSACSPEGRTLLSKSVDFSRVCLASRF